MQTDSPVFGEVPKTKTTAELPAVQVEAHELASFETMPGSGAVIPVMWSIEKHTVAQEIALSGLSKNAISRKTGVPLSAINKWLEHCEFREYINDIVLEKAQTMKAQSLMILNKMLQARLDEAERTNDYAGLSKADTLEIINTIRKETGGDQRKDETTYAQILERMLQASQPKTIELPTAPKSDA